MGQISTSPSRLRRILVIEDEPGHRELIRRAFLAYNDQIEIVMAFDGEIGLERINQGGWDIILLDLKLPKLTGQQILERVDGSMLIIIVLSTSRQLVEIKNAYQNKAKAYIQKPVTLTRLNEVLSALGLFWFDDNVKLPIGNNL